MVIKNTTTLGGTASHVKVGKIAHGLMMMTWRADPIPDEEAFEAIKAGIDSMPPGVKIVLNSGEFYDRQLGTGNLEMISRFFEKYPELADKAFLSVKGGLKERSFEVDSSPENLRRSINNVISALRGKKRVDLFQSARVDDKIPIEDAIKTLKGLVAEGLFDHIGVSECRAETLRRANAVHPIAAAEIEVSPWQYDELTKAVLATAEELGIAVAAYSPLGRGFLTGTIKSPSDIKPGDIRAHFTRFNREDIFKHNLALVDALKSVADKKGITPAQLCIAWVASLGERVIPLPGSSNKKRTLENLASGDIELTSEDKAQIAGIIASHEVKGDRYYGGDPETLHLWG